MNKVLACDIIIKLLSVFMLIVIAFELNPELSTKTVAFFQNLFDKIKEYTQKIEVETETSTEMN